MSINIEYFIEQKYQGLHFQDVLTTEPLYDDYCNDNVYFKKLLAIMHQEFNRLFSFMYSKLNSNGHYNALESRDLLNYIKLYKDTSYVLKDTEYAFKIKDEYKQLIENCATFLQKLGGSPIPGDLIKIELLEYEPIFEMSQNVLIPTINTERRYPIKLIGEGSYAHVFKYKDEFYNKFFVIKRAKKELDPKELQRFKREYEIMKSLHSPHVLEVYHYDEDKNEYYAEYADETLYNFISHNPNLDIVKRINIANQIFKGLSYV